MKKLISILIILSVFTVCIIGSSLADDYVTGNVAIEIDGVRVGFFDSNNQPLDIKIINDSPYVPILPLLDSLGIQYQIADNKISISKLSSEGASNTSSDNERIEITPENFSQYFSISCDVINEKRTGSITSWGFTASGNVKITIDAKEPCEIHDISFSIKAYTNAGDVSFNGVMPQNASFSSTSNELSVSDLLESRAYIDVGDFRNGQYKDWDVLDATGYIILK